MIADFSASSLRPSSPSSWMRVHVVIGGCKYTVSMFGASPIRLENGYGVWVNVALRSKLFGCETGGGGHHYLSRFLEGSKPAKCLYHGEFLILIA